jgi:hypothetical protein
MKEITEDQAKLQWAKNVAKHNLPVDMLGKTINYNGDDYIVVGLSHRVRKNGLVVKRPGLAGLPSELLRIPLEALSAI